MKNDTIFILSLFGLVFCALFFYFGYLLERMGYSITKTGNLITKHGKPDI